MRVVLAKLAALTAMLHVLAMGSLFLSCQKSSFALTGPQALVAGATLVAGALVSRQVWRRSRWAEVLLAFVGAVCAAFVLGHLRFTWRIYGTLSGQGVWPQSALALAVYGLWVVNGGVAALARWKRT
jgi:hypothetical protein